ncbi:Aste57867_510 [Aphanomyces stellatus]|uniref:Aste57867_510 protein n=1 Tax=Aphanomyces stellatus TaxID=120398 RepID=A0A485K6X4_9STRA|nr:hypothetical protein As57867_000509 [Aphanomyces stellatus]VFT77735.1 Aste57867_510 [Aphanomyces stellatus]
MSVRGLVRHVDDNVQSFGREPDQSRRVVPCSKEEFDSLHELIHATDQVDGGVPSGSSLPSRGDPTSSISIEPTCLKGSSVMDSHMSTSEALEAAGGLAYVVFTIVMSFYYLSMLTPAMANDLWWVGFNASGAQSYLIDLFNAQLNLESNGSIPLTDMSFGLPKDYSTYYTPIEVTPVYARVVLATSAHDFRIMIPALRQVSSPDGIATQYCWIDFNRTFEVAHTDLRQRRCNQRYTANAAVYWESLCRLVDWNSWMASAQPNFDQTMGNALRQSPAGLQWLHATPNAYHNLDAEVAYWLGAGMTKYDAQYTNLFSWGVDETILVTNAFGASQSISIKRVATTQRGALWTTAIMCWGPWNDYILTNIVQTSFVRSDPANHRFSPPCSYTEYLVSPANYTCDPCNLPWNPIPGNCQMDYDMVFGLPPTPGWQMTRTNIGPFGSVDLYFQSLPPSLIALYSTFTRWVTQSMLTSDAFYDAMMDVPSYTADPVPSSWQGGQMWYFGGDPTCPARVGMPFVQSSFAFDVSCTDQSPNSLLLHRFNVLFAMAASGNVSQEVLTQQCLLCPTMATSCNAVVAATAHAWSILNQVAPLGVEFFHNAQVSHSDINTMGVALIQYAVNTTDGNTVNAFLQQFLLSQPPALWNFFGWVYIYDWAQYSREVVSFEGDNGIFTLLSNKYNPTINQAQALEVPKSACQYLWVVSAVVSSILGFVAILVATYSFLIRGRVVGRNLLHFNRIGGSVWLGRPFMMVRGMTAIILLSSSPIHFITHNNYSRFAFQPRSLFDEMVVAGEAMWITYAINDVLLVLTRHSQPRFAPLSAWLGWIIYVVMGASNPYVVDMIIDRACSINIAGNKITCVSGTVQIGDIHRATLFASIQFMCIVFAFLSTRLWYVYTKHEPGSSINGHLLLSGTATAFVHKDMLRHGAWLIDRASCVLCGLLTYRDFVFDVKLWIFVEEGNAQQVKWNMKIFPQPDLTRNMDSVYDKSSHRDAPKPLSRILAVVGLAYMCSTIFGSVTYLTLTQTNMANDFWWANYNSSREHIFISRLFNQELIVRSHVGAIALDDPKFVDDANYNISSPTPVIVQMNPLYVSQVLSTDSTNIATVIRGLRTMDACLAPWIATQYCWLDFNRHWEMANSVNRQSRCMNKYTSNGAVYLEGILRNVKREKLMSCWRTSLEIGILSTINQTEEGTSWWFASQSVHTSISDEVGYWRSYTIATYATDWQNYKSIGLIDTFSIENAFGFSYDMTLKHTNGSLTLSSQTSMKMYWGFASDLWAITSPSTAIYGASLIRTSSNFAFSNVSMESVLLQNGTIHQTSIVQGAYAAFRSFFGPFGSVDLRRVPVPASLFNYIVQVKDTLTIMRMKSDDFSKQYLNLPQVGQFAYAPLPWLTGYVQFVAGGNLLCNDVSPYVLKSSTSLLTGISSACNSGLGEFLAPSPLGSLMGVIGANLVRANLTATETSVICSQIFGVDISTCVNALLGAPVQFLLNSTLFPDSTVIPSLQALARIAEDDILKLGVEFFQYGKENQSSTEVVLLRHNIFDPAVQAFHFLAWQFAADWCTAVREVISFEGDVGMINVISSPNVAVGSLVNSLEIPVNVSGYIRYMCLYITVIIICVAIIATFYLIASRGYVEGLNFFEINRVGGLVWIGRTFLFVRSMAAICLLSTQVLSLETSNYLWFFESNADLQSETAMDKAIRLFKTFLAAGEVSWLGFVLSDMLMCNFMVWGSSAILSLAFPTTHTATLFRRCEIPQVDYQLVCSSGVISIGRFDRFVLLIAICVICIFVCYMYERLRHPKLASSQPKSLFLSISAKYVFEPARWMDHDVGVSKLPSIHVSLGVPFRPFVRYIEWDHFTSDKK